MKRLSVHLLLVLQCLLLPGCALLEAPLNLIENMFGAVGRSLHVDAQPRSPQKPIHLQPGEIEDGAKTLPGSPADTNPTVLSSEAAVAVK